MAAAIPYIPFLMQFIFDVLDRRVSRFSWFEEAGPFVRLIYIDDVPVVDDVDVLLVRTRLAKMAAAIHSFSHAIHI